MDPGGSLTGQLGLHFGIPRIGLPDVSLTVLPGWRIAADEVVVVLCDPGVAPALAQPPPEGLGEGADRMAVLRIGDDAGAPDPFWSARSYFSLPRGVSAEHVGRAVRSIFRILEDRASSARARRSLASRTEEIRALLDVGVSLAAERDRDRLLEKILSSARALTHADAGSLYLVDPSGEDRSLRFVAAQNDSVRFDFVERTLPLDDSSIAGFVGRNAQVLNLADVARIPPEAPYRFDPQIDLANGYRTRSMLAVPLTTPQGNTIGVLQLLNRMRRTAPADFSITAVFTVEIVPFDAGDEEIARALAAQAAVAVENGRLTENIRRLFEGFVEASVTAIEQRDPTTSGHSLRVARLSCGLAEAAGREDSGPFASYRIGGDELRELRYAAVLHDFGKVGVREQVLVKAKKLPPGNRDLIRARLDQAILSAAAETWERAARERWTEKQVAAALAARVGELERTWNLVVKADEPSLLETDTGAELEQVSRLSYRDASGHLQPVLLPRELAFLSIPKGSLNAQERQEIESHVTQTFRFLTKIPWTPDLSRVPDWAYAHHEKLDGSGYPRRLDASQIPLPVRAITISDIYDALAARDRPYKKAVPSDRALDILREEARRGVIDADLLDLFIAAKVYEAALRGSR
jgi:HD-GYP domain-containing protein (c-di-GMP phosphodiesterase class II)